MTSAEPRRPGRPGLARFGTRLLAGLLAGLVLLACSRPPEVHDLQGRTMGTYWKVRVAALPAGLALPELREEIEAVLEAVNAEMSTYREDALITRFNRAGEGEAFDLPPGFARVLSAALDLAAQTDGAYDPTVGPLVNLWGFGPDGMRASPPEQAKLDAARARVGWQRLVFDRASDRLVQPGEAYLDLSSIAKGDAVDRIVELLGERGVRSALVDLGGDMRAVGTRPDGSPWRIAVERPVPGSRDIHSVVGLPAGMAVATSGSYRNYFESGGRVFSHTIDPRTAEPVAHRVVSVTVVADTCLEADGLATALGVLGAEAGMAFARERGLAVLFLVADDDRVIDLSTPEFDRLALESP